MKTLAILLGICLLILTGCSSEPHETLPSSSASWIGNLIVWNGNLYVKVDERAEQADRQLGTVTQYSMDETDSIDLSGTFSDCYPVGTKLYALPGKPESDYIVVPNADGSFDVLKSQGKYGSAEPAS